MASLFLNDLNYFQNIVVYHNFKTWGAVVPEEEKVQIEGSCSNKYL